MANFAQVTINFTGATSEGDTFACLIEVDGLPIVTIAERGVSLRQSPNEFTIAATASESSDNLEAALTADYGQVINVFNAGPTSIGLEATDYSQELNVVQIPVNCEVIYVPPVPPPDLFAITGVTAQAADLEDRNIYARFNVSVENFTEPFQINSPVAKSAPLVSDLFFDYLRQPPTPLQQLSITDGDSDTATLGGSEFTADYFTLDSVTVNESSQGATVIANITLVSGAISSIREYSLDNDTWRTSSTFTGILAGNYTMYVRDNLGAQYQEDFIVEGVLPDKPDPHHEVVNANPLRFIEEIDFDCDNIPNWDNALFQDILNYNFPNVEKRCFNQLISSCDTIPTQIRTNYDNVAINIYKDGEIFLSPTAELKKDNILKKQKVDCAFKQVESGEYQGKTFLYFPGGNIYEPDTTNVTGRYNNPSNKVFPFAVNGALFIITGTSQLNGDYTQLGEVFDLPSGYSGIALGFSYSGSPVTTGQVEVIYNEKIYNVWEFSTVGSVLDKGVYHTEIELTDDDPRYNDVKYISEPLEKIDSTYGTAIIEASSTSENTADIDFTTGIVLKLRVPCRFIVASNVEEDDSFESQEGKKTITKSVIKRVIPLESDYVPFYMAEKIAVLSSLDSLQINKIQVVKGEDTEVESKAGDRNPFVVINRQYQQNDQTTISDSVGITTGSQRVIGTTRKTVIGI